MVFARDRRSGIPVRFGLTVMYAQSVEQAVELAVRLQEVAPSARGAPAAKTTNAIAIAERGLLGDIAVCANHINGGLVLKCGLVGSARKNLGTALRAAPVRSSLPSELLDLGGYVAQAADALRHLNAEVLRSFTVDFDAWVGADVPDRDISSDQGDSVSVGAENPLAHLQEDDAVEQAVERDEMYGAHFRGILKRTSAGEHGCPQSLVVAEVLSQPSSIRKAALDTFGADAVSSGEDRATTTNTIDRVTAIRENKNADFASPDNPAAAIGVRGDVAIIGCDSRVDDSSSLACIESLGSEPPAAELRDASGVVVQSPAFLELAKSLPVVPTGINTVFGKMSRTLVESDISGMVAYAAFTGRSAPADDVGMSRQFWARHFGVAAGDAISEVATQPRTKGS